MDGCRGGWAVALRRVGDGALQIRLLERLEQALALPERPARIALDMPIGLAAVATSGGRPCERAARALLPGKASSVFSLPCRAALAATDYAEALRLNRASGPDGVGLSKQAFNLLDKLREVDRLMTPRLQGRLFEAHPELAFALINGGRPVLMPKRTPEGRRLRQRLLGRAGLRLERLQLEGLPRGMAIDDALDAAALTRTAERRWLGQATQLPARRHVDRDARGLRMEIWY